MWWARIKLLKLNLTIKINEKKNWTSLPCGSPLISLFDLLPSYFPVSNMVLVSQVAIPLSFQWYFIFKFRKDSEGVQDMPHQICLLDILIILSWRHLKKIAMEGDAFWTPFICLWQIFQKELNCPKSPPREFHHTGKTDSHQRAGDQKATSHPDKLYHTPSHLPSLLRAYCSFLKIIYSPLSDLCPPSPALIINNKVYKLSNLTLFGYSLFIPCDALVHTTWKINKSVYISFLLLINLLLVYFTDSGTEPGWAEGNLSSPTASHVNCNSLSHCTWDKLHSSIPFLTAILPPPSPYLLCTILTQMRRRTESNWTASHTSILCLYFWSQKHLLKSLRLHTRLSSNSLKHCLRLSVTQSQSFAWILWTSKAGLFVVYWPHEHIPFY